MSAKRTQSTIKNVFSEQQNAFTKMYLQLDINSKKRKYFDFVRLLKTIKLHILNH